jgi:hypothetical protein
MRLFGLLGLTFSLELAVIAGLCSHNSVQVAAWQQ